MSPATQRDAWLARELLWAKRMRTRLSITLAVAALQLGCSFIGVRRAPDGALAGEPLDCTTSQVLPALDAAAAGTEVLAVALLPAIANQGYPKPSTAYLATVVGVHLGWLALYAGSAVWGFKQTGRCQEAKLRRCFREGRDAPCDLEGPPFTMPQPQNISSKVR